MILKMMNGFQHCVEVYQTMNFNKRINSMQTINSNMMINLTYMIDFIKLMKLWNKEINSIKEKHFFQVHFHHDEGFVGHKHQQCNRVHLCSEFNDACQQGIWFHQVDEFCQVDESYQVKDLSWSDLLLNINRVWRKKDSH